MSHVKHSLFWLSFPFLIPQALYVRQTAPRFAGAGGPKSGTVGSGPALRLLAIGDSIIDGVGASTLDKALVGQTAALLSSMTGRSVEWHALGVSGFDAKAVIERLLPKIPEQPFDGIVVSVGVNDITGLTTLRNWRRRLTQLLLALSSHSPNATIALSGMPPMHGFPLLPQPLRASFGLRARVFDAVAKEVAGDLPGVEHLPLHFEPDPDKFSPDGYHPSEESYTVFGGEMAELLAAHIEPAREEVATRGELR